MFFWPHLVLEMSCVKCKNLLCLLGAWDAKAGCVERIHLKIYIIASVCQGLFMIFFFFLN